MTFAECLSVNIVAKYNLMNQKMYIRCMSFMVRSMNSHYIIM